MHTSGGVIWVDLCGAMCVIKNSTSQHNVFSCETPILCVLSRVLVYIMKQEGLNNNDDNYE